VLEDSVTDDHISENVTVLNNINLVKGEVVIDNQNLIVDLLLLVGRVDEDLVAILIDGLDFFFLHLHVRTSTVKLLLAFKSQFEDTRLVSFAQRTLTVATRHVVSQILLFNSLHNLPVG